MNVFGTVADLYERVRPGYPPEIAASILAYHGGTPASVVEVGAGTGKGTDVLVRIGAPLTCVEPDARMAARLTERFPDARVEVTTFERWASSAGGVDVLACAMAWHWLDAATRNALAPDAEGGTRLLLEVVMRTNPVIALGGCLGDLVMARRQLLNLKRLAEESAVPGR
ncbi:class I SAM-dependent methyltransferase [Micromonospora chalcea]|uniref:class I SAM-dependent methyltransferase n=1 Tax=Micromonospora chalcea TaxID=1874 RepID=UPI0037F1D7AF